MPAVSLPLHVDTPPADTFSHGAARWTAVRCGDCRADGRAHGRAHGRADGRSDCRADSRSHCRAHPGADAATDKAPYAQANTRTHAAPYCKTPYKTSYSPSDNKAPYKTSHAKADQEKADKAARLPAAAPNEAAHEEADPPPGPAAVAGCGRCAG